MEAKEKERNMHTISYSQLKPGTIVVYLLRPSQLLMNPKKEWRGRIKRLQPSQQMVIVDILNEGLNGEEEPVFLDQIIRIEQEEKE